MGFDYFIHEPSGSGNLRTYKIDFMMNRVKFEEFADMYQAPVVECMEVEVEKGFAISPGGSGGNGESGGNGDAGGSGSDMGWG